MHWTLTIRDRAQGWLTPDFHRAFRWGLLHGCARYQVACPVYCLMPDHVHLLIHGWSARADQLRFIRFFRRYTAPWLKAGDSPSRTLAWQKQAYDHVLRSQESDRYAFEALAHYILENPVRAGLVESRFDWRYSGAVVPGYPELKISLPDYWTRYWRIVRARSLDA